VTPDLTPEGLRVRALEFECCDEWHYQHNRPARERVDKICAAFTALVAEARRAQREADATIANDYTECAYDSGESVSQVCRSLAAAIRTQEETP